LQKRKLGDFAVSVIGLGTVKFGRNQGVKYPSAFDLPDDAVLRKLLATAKELGINLLDTAPAYGVSEERLGKLLQGERHDWIISTKVGEEFRDQQSFFDFSPDAIVQSVERSLKRLHTDYLDIVLVHSSGEDERIIHEDQVFSTLAALKESGKIRAFGMSSKTVVGGMLTVDHADVAMVTFHSQDQQDREVIQYAQQKQKGIFIKKALASGHMKMSAGDCIRFALSEQGVTSVIIGTINEGHLRENCAGV